MQSALDLVNNYLKKHEKDIYADLKRLVLCEASTSDIEKLSKVRECITDLVKKRCDIDTLTINKDAGHPMLTYDIGKGEKILILGHYDTVHPIGSVPFFEDDDVMAGPGTYDMKGGIIYCIWALKAILDLGLSLNNNLVFLFNGDEETGSKESKATIVDYAKGAKAAFVAESPTKAGALKMSRSGTLDYEVTIQGKQAHAGNGFFDGASAIYEMAHEIVKIEGLTDIEKNTTVSVGLAEGGEKANVIPGHAKYSIDCRFSNEAERLRLVDAIENMDTVIPDTTRECVYIGGRLPLEETKESTEIFNKAKEYANSLGLQLEKEHVRGVSDGNFTANMGIPTIDGLGPKGYGGHAVDERIIKDDFITRLAVFTMLMLDI